MSCAVRDVLNWRCRWEKSDATAPSEYVMADDSYSETVGPPMVPTTTLFYQVPRGRWMVKLSELGGKR
jgi:hypothetical protein